jgi:hypothetical protein
VSTLHGSDASGTFTDATITWTTGSTVAANQPLAIRVVKEGGSGTVVDFDNARLTATALNDFNSWIDDFGLAPADQDFADDSDNDGLENGLEAWLGTHPGQFNSGLADVSSTGLTTSITSRRPNRILRMVAQPHPMVSQRRRPKWRTSDHLHHLHFRQHHHRYRDSIC